MGVFEVGGACGEAGQQQLSITARTCFNYRQVVAPRLLVERMSISEVGGLLLATGFEW